MNRSFWKAGHAPTLLSAFLYFDVSFMVWYLLGPLQVQIAQALALDTQQRALMVAVPILCGAVLRLFLGLLADPDSELTQAQLAQRVKMSPYYLSDVFRRQTGLTIPAYRNRLRLQGFFRRFQARPEIRLLQHALDAGFGSYAQFYRVFTSALGLPPREWLRQTAAPPS